MNVPSKRAVRTSLSDLATSVRGVRAALETETIDIGASLAKRSGGAVRRELTPQELVARYERAMEGVAVGQRVMARLYTQLKRRKAELEDQIATTRRSA